MNPITLLAAITGSAAVFLLALAAHGAVKRPSILEANQALIAKQQQAYKRGSAGDRIRLALSRYGYQGSIQAGLFAAIVAAILTNGALRGFGVSAGTAALFSFPVTFAAAFLMLARLAASRDARFNVQLLQLLRLLSSELEAGTTPQQAMEQVTGSVESPLREEMIATLDAAKVSGDLVAEMAALAARFPSRAMTMLVTALELDRDLGAPIHEPLMRAAEALEADFELEETAAAEVAQVKAEFYAVFGGIGVISVMVFFTQSEESRAAVFGSFPALILLAVGFANYIFGFMRVKRMISKAGAQE